MITLNSRTTALLPNIAFLIVALTIGFGLSNAPSHAQSSAINFAPVQVAEVALR